MSLRQILDVMGLSPESAGLGENGSEFEKEARCLVKIGPCW